MEGNKKILIDILTPKQALFFNALSKKLVEMGFHVDLTTRKYSEVEGMLNLLRLKAEVIGRHGGADLFEKLSAYSERVLLLAKVVKKTRPDLILSFGSPEAARVAFGLNIPHVMVNDSPHAYAVGKLTVPLSTRIFTPWIIPKRDWVALGAAQESIEHYHGLDPVIWLRNFRPNKRVLSDLNLDEKKLIISYRPEEFKAAYLANEKPVTTALVHDAISGARTKANIDFQLVIIARYGAVQSYYDSFKREAIYVNKCIDTRSLIYFSSIFVGGGGTMLAESALLGTPTISVYPGMTKVESYLIEKGKVHKNLNAGSLEKTIISFLELGQLEREKMRVSSRKTLEKMESPDHKILPFIDRLLSR